MDDIRLTQEQADAVISKVYQPQRYTWCESVSKGGCGCMGCVNVSGGALLKGVTKEQWQDWVDRHPKPDGLHEGTVGYQKCNLCNEVHSNKFDCTKPIDPEYELYLKLKAKFEGRY